MSVVARPHEDNAHLPWGGGRVSDRRADTSVVARLPEDGTRSSNRRMPLSARGFTLLEVLIALAILATALIAGFRAVGLATSNAQDLEERQLAEWVALNRLAGHRIIGEFLETGTYEGVEQQSSYEFHWKEEVKATPNALVRRTEVRVYNSTDSEHALAKLTGFMVKPLQ